MVQRSKHNKRLIALFLLGYVLLNYPMISLFNLQKLVWGIPLLYGYIFFAWVLLILLVVFIFSAPADPP